MKVSKTKFKDLLIISGETHKDKRGFLRELYFQKFIRVLIYEKSANEIHDADLRVAGSDHGFG